MTDNLPGQTDALKLARRSFMRDAATAAAMTCVAPGLLGCKAAVSGMASGSPGADAMEEALEMMAGLAPLTNHGPMAAEALVALGRADSVVPFTEAYKKRFRSSYPEARRVITRKNWREALGDGNRVADWTRFFDQELKEAAWQQVLGQWAGDLAPGLAAAAAHGLIRTAHATRSLSVKESGLRRHELAEGLGYWAAYYQPLPETQNAGTGKLKPAQAIAHIPLLPDERRMRGSIMVGLRSLDDFPPFAGAVNLADTTGKAEQVISELTEAFAEAYVKRASERNFITLIHAVTGTTALRSLLPYLRPETARSMLRYGWQMAAALYSISGDGPGNNLQEGKEASREDLIDRAVASKDEHAIKFTEACLREYALNPKPVYLRAARDCVGRLGLS